MSTTLANLMSTTLALWQIAHSLAAIADALEGQGNGLAIDLQNPK